MSNGLLRFARVATLGLLTAGHLLLFYGAASAAAAADEFRVKREAVFAFAQKPVVTREGDTVTITFETKGFCDATVAVESERGQIVRHLASGVLGPNAPAPFRPNAKKQTVVWDGKDDRGRYVEHPRRLTVRVSLGLKPRFERTLYWEPRKRISGGDDRPAVAAAPEGVYVYDPDTAMDGGCDHLRLFDHTGAYVRTVYPYPAAKVDRVAGLQYRTYPQDGRRLPLKTSGYGNTLLAAEPSGHGRAPFATAMAVRGDRIILAAHRILRLGTDGASGGIPLGGVAIARQITVTAFNRHRYDRIITPRSAALSPDGAVLYLTAYGWWNNHHRPFEWLNGVMCVNPLDAADTPAVFVGSMERTSDKEYTNGGGAKPGQFRAPTSVACDGVGRIYVADYMNDRVQVFSPEGTFLKAIAVNRPAIVQVHQRTGEVYVASWFVPNQFAYADRATRAANQKMQPTLTRLGAFGDERVIGRYALPLRKMPRRMHPPDRVEYDFALDSWADPPAIWLVPATPMKVHLDGPWQDSGLMVLEIQGDRLAVKHDFGKETRASVRRVRPTPKMRHRLAVNPVDGTLYVCEGVPIEASADYRAFGELIRIDPETGRVQLVPVPITSEDLCFDLQGYAYLRGNYSVMRYDADWKEVPWDYGTSSKGVGWGGGGPFMKRTPARGALMLPGKGYGGFCVSPEGLLAVAHMSGPEGTVLNSETSYTAQVRRAGLASVGGVKPYKATLYPGRELSKRSVIIHVFDDRGRLVRKDTVKGLGMTAGVKIDRAGDLYVLDWNRRLIDGKPYVNTEAGTLMKFKGDRGRLVTGNRRIPLPLPADGLPKRAPDLARRGNVWADGAEWMYGAASYTRDHGCYCHTSRFDLDLFARSFVSEVDRYCVAVLDANGNLIMRVGQYGNVDDGAPLIAAGGPPHPRSIAGDEVAIFHSLYVATHSDRRLFIADYGNARILSVKLGYHTSERILLSRVADGS